MSDPALSKLLEVDSDLAVQETGLLAQLEAIRAKRASLQSVVKIFASDEKPTSEENGAVAAIPAEIAAPTASKTKAPQKQVSQKRKPVSVKAKEKKTQPTTPSKSAKQPRRGWREYVRDEFRKTPLSEVVLWILQDQPDEVFEIAKMVDAIFVKSIPQAVRKGARERVSNILAEGARKDQWYRGDTGEYSLSKI